jgi:hypothetical protein
VIIVLFAFLKASRGDEMIFLIFTLIDFNISTSLLKIHILAEEECVS